ARRLLVRAVDDDDVGQLSVGDAARHGGAHVACSTDYRYSSGHKMTSPRFRRVILRAQLAAARKKRKRSRATFRSGPPTPPTNSHSFCAKVCGKGETFTARLRGIWKFLAVCTTAGRSRACFRTFRPRGLYCRPSPEPSPCLQASIPR